jgi:hypothetical protein
MDILGWNFFTIYNHVSSCQFLKGMARYENKLTIVQGTSKAT